MAFALRTIGTRQIQRANKECVSALVLKRKLYSEQQQKLGRPLSPHLQIYKFPIVAISSVTVRATGIVMASGVFFLPLGLNIYRFPTI